MAESSFPFTTSSLATEQQWSRLIRALGVLPEGVTADDPAGTVLKVTANGTSTISIAAGDALVNGFYYRSDAVINKTVPANATGSTRKDRIVLRSSQSANLVTCEYVTGGTAPPTLQANRDDVYEMSLAQFDVLNGTSVAQAAAVIDQRFFNGKPVAVGNVSSRRPPAKGQILVEYSGSDPILYVGTGSAWVQIYPVSSAHVWTTPGLSTGWINYGGSFQPARYTKMADGLVVLQGMLQRTSAHAGPSVPIFTLSAGFRPSHQQLYQCNTGDETDPGAVNWGRVDVNSDGTVVYLSGLASGDWVSLNGIVYPV